MEVTTWVEALRWQRAALGGSASTQAATRVNVINWHVRFDERGEEPWLCGRASEAPTDGESRRNTPKQLLPRC